MKYSVTFETTTYLLKFDYGVHSFLIEITPERKLRVISLWAGIYGIDEFMKNKKGWWKRSESNIAELIEDLTKLEEISGIFVEAKKQNRYAINDDIIQEINRINKKLFDIDEKLPLIDFDSYVINLHLNFVSRIAHK